MIAVARIVVSAALAVLTYTRILVHFCTSSPFQQYKFYPYNICQDNTVQTGNTKFFIIVITYRFNLAGNYLTETEKSSYVLFTKFIARCVQYSTLSSSRVDNSSNRGSISYHVYFIDQCACSELPQSAHRRRYCCCEACLISELKTRWPPNPNYTRKFCSATYLTMVDWVS